MFGVSESFRESIGVSLTPSDRVDYDRALAATRTGLGEEAFAVVWAEGRAMSMKEAIDYALKVAEKEGDSHSTE